MENANRLRRGLETRTDNRTLVTTGPTNGGRSAPSYRHEIDDGNDTGCEVESYRELFNTIRPHSRLDYRTPSEVRQTWGDGRRLQKTAA